MAKSPSHALGQIVGYALEQAFYPMLLPVADDFALFLDRQGARPARGKKKKVTWIDDDDNSHDLDFVLEKYGSANEQGAPAAFIESAWRRYTKHSMNKASEISGALVPLRRKYRFDRPFLGVMIAGEWTRAAITQLESQGISVMHLPLAVLVDSFAVEGVDLNVVESTAEEDLRAQVDKWNSIGVSGRENVISTLQKESATPFESFIKQLREHLSRQVQSVVILPLHGLAHTVASVAEALSILSAMETTAPDTRELELLRIEIQVRYSNTDKIDATFGALSEAILWLEQHYLDR